MKFSKPKLLVITVLIISSVGLLSFTHFGDRYFEIAKNLDIFATLYKEVNAYYVDEVNPNTLMRKGIDAMLESLDPYTNYIPEDDIEDFMTLSTGQYGGIGAQTSRINNRVFIRMVFEGYAAHKGGLKIGDEVIKINDVPIKGLNRDEVGKLMKGQVNTPVSISVKRFNVKDEIKITFKREKITIKSVPYYGMVIEDIGYLQLTEFTMHAGREVKSAVEQLKNKGAEKIILDLRGNPGGLLIEAVNIVNLFVPKGQEVVSTKGKIAENNASYKALNNPLDTEIPLVILINSGSASASEIVSGAIQDLDRGVLIGERSFGKGLVQTTRPLSYNSQLKVTTAKYYIPSGRSIQVLDYSHRRPDGSVGKIPDSLKSAYNTKNGRLIYDGGGIAPDIEVNGDIIPSVAVSLMQKGLIFDYATQFYYTHEPPHSAKEFKLTNSEYDDFINWLKDKKYDYITYLEKLADELEAEAKNEKYFNNIKNDLDNLNLSIINNKKSDLYSHKGTIKYMLEKEIANRYFMENGEIEVSFDKDEAILKAVEVLSNPTKYRQILSIN